MIPNKSISFFLLITLLYSCKASDIIGNWHRTNLTLAPGIEIKNNETAGNLILSPDSTFRKIGLEIKDTSDVTGSQNGRDMSGRWYREKRILHLEGQITDVVLRFRYKIIRASKQRLILKTHNPMEQRRFRHKEKYKRI